MSTVTCHDCSTPISNDVQACPVCGAHARHASPRSGRWLAAAGLCLLGAGGYALSDSSEAAERARALGASVAVRHADVGVTTAYTAGLVVDRGIDEGVRVVNAGSVAGCRLLGRFETRGAVMDPDQPTREIRRQAHARAPRANTIVVSSPPPWPGQVSVEMYDCPE